MKKILFISSYRAHIPRQKLLLDELKKYFDLYIREFEPNGGDMGEKAVKMLSYADSVIKEIKPDALLVRGDRSEVLPIAVAGAYNGVKIIHFEGGDMSGVIDQRVRFAITYLSDYHFVTNDEAHTRLINYGIPMDRIWNYGSLDVEYAAKVEPKKLKERKYLLIAYHPVPGEDENELTEALKTFKDYDIISVTSNKDYGRSYGEETFSPEDYINLLRYASCLVGNSSSFLKEASIMGVGVCNIGDRQNKRLKPKNVLDVPCETEKIKLGIEFQLKNKYEYDIMYFKDKSSQRITQEILKILN